MDSHYVPQMYLKGWEYVTPKPHQKKHNWIYEKGVAHYLSAFKNHAFIPDYYENLTEQWLCKEMEHKTAPIFKKLGQMQSINDRERLQLARFIFVMWNRVPANINGIGKDINELVIEQELTPFKQWKPYLGKLFDVMERLLRHQIMERKTYSELIKRDNYGQSRIIADMCWRFLRAAPDTEFVTSDNPFCYRRDIGIGAGQTGAKARLYGYFLFPIDKNTVLISSNINQPGKDFDECSELRVKDLNRRIIENAEKQVYAAIESDEIADLVNERIGRELEIKHKINRIYPPRVLL